jgi:threonine/homoserine/homoserine lactone efflux protein
MLVDWRTLAVFVPVAAVFVVMPGPDFMYIAANAVAYGKRGGVYSALGTTSGAFAHVLLAAFGLTAIVATYQPAYEFVRMAGAAYLAFLGIRMMLSSGRPGSLESRSAVGARSFYGRGFLNNLMNPKVIIFMLTFLPQFADPARGPLWAQIAILGAVLCVVMITIEIPIALTAGHLGVRLGGRMKATNYVNKAMGAFMVTLAVYVFRARQFAH